MNPATPALASERVGAMRRAFESRWLLLYVFVLAYLWPIIGAAYVYHTSGFADLTLFREWVHTGLTGGGWPVIDRDWVYPFGALLPMLVLAPVHSLSAYAPTWIAMSFVLNAVVLLVLESGGTSRRTASWFWALSVLLLGAVAISRLESVMVPMLVLGLLAVPRRPALAAGLLTLAGWIKVLPFFWLVPLVFCVRRWSVVCAAAVASAVVLAPAVAFGSGTRIFSFLTQQSSRGLQVESVPATVEQARRLFGGGPAPYFNRVLNTVEFNGRSASSLAHLADVLLLPALAVVFVLSIRALRVHKDRPLPTLAVSVFLISLTLIIVNKVGSPQYVAWLFAPVVLGLVHGGDRHGREWRRWAALVLFMAGLTQVVYPVAYSRLMSGEALVLWILIVRNALLVVLGVWATWRLWTLGKAASPAVDAAALAPS